ncbi:MAG: DUF3598 domain-containing protein [Pseudomonadota bacterium]
MSAIREAMPLLARHEGVWDGWYRYFDRDGNKIDEHRSRLICRFPDGGEWPYHQTNHYTWENGETEDREFPAEYRDGRVWFDNELITGWAAEVGLDSFNRSVMLFWERKGEPGLVLYEMIQLSDCGRYRQRVWQWIRDGRIAQRTLIDEEKVSEQWEGATRDTLP